MKKQQYFVRLIGTRPGWPENMTADEERIMSEHFAYLKDLTAQKRVLMAGPVERPPIGLIILEVDSEDDAHAIMNHEPSVVQGVHTYEMSPMRVSLMAEKAPESRYPKETDRRRIHKEVVVEASLDDVWESWTTTAGVKTFFSPEASVELLLGGPFEIYFDRSAPEGSRGSEDCRILSFLPGRMLSFEWNTPPHFGRMRQVKTCVVIFFEPVEPGRVKVSFNHVGWGTGDRWNEVYDYFDKAWTNVLANFEKSITDGPLNWEE